MKINKKDSNILGATIHSIIVAFIYVIIIISIIYFLFANSISRAISLIDLVSVKTTERFLKDVKIDLSTKDLESYPEYGTQYAKIEIPSLGIDLPLYYGSKLSILRNGIGQATSAYFPGEGGSIICMGHNTASMLKKLPKIKNGDKIIITATYGTYTYEVYNTKIVDEKALDEAPVQRDKEILMLYTCYPVDGFGHATDRFFVYANLVEKAEQ